MKGDQDVVNDNNTKSNQDKDKVKDFDDDSLFNLTFSSRLFDDEPIFDHPKPKKAQLPVKSPSLSTQTSSLKLDRSQSAKHSHQSRSGTNPATVTNPTTTRKSSRLSFMNDSSGEGDSTIDLSGLDDGYDNEKSGEYNAPPTTPKKSHNNNKLPTHRSTQANVDNSRFKPQPPNPSGPINPVQAQNSVTRSVATASANNNIGGIPSATTTSVTTRRRVSAVGQTQQMDNDSSRTHTPIKRPTRATKPGTEIGKPKRVQRDD
jgi:hypothetical protein